MSRVFLRSVDAGTEHSLSNKTTSPTYYISAQPAPASFPPTQLLAALPDEEDQAEERLRLLEAENDNMKQYIAYTDAQQVHETDSLSITKYK